MRTLSNFVALLLLSVVSGQGVLFYEASVENFDLVNNLRRSEGAKPIQWDETLYQKTLQWSKQMYEEDKLYHSHYNLAENVAYGQNLYTADGVAQGFFQQWATSTKGHRENMLSTSHTCGAVAIYGDGTRFFGTQIFDRCAPAATATGVLYNQSIENFEMVNVFRNGEGENKIVWDEHLYEMAMNWSTIMYYEQRLYHSDYNLAENVAGSNRMYTFDTVAQGFFDQWEGSTRGHRENMLYSSHTCGAAAIFGDGNVFYGTQLFASSCHASSTSIDTSAPAVPTESPSSIPSQLYTTNPSASPSQESLDDGVETPEMEPSSTPEPARTSFQTLETEQSQPARPSLKPSQLLFTSGLPATSQSSTQTQPSEIPVQPSDVEPLQSLEAQVDVSGSIGVNIVPSQAPGTEFAQVGASPLVNVGLESSAEPSNNMEAEPSSSDDSSSFLEDVLISTPPSISQPAAFVQIEPSAEPVEVMFSTAPYVSIEQTPEQIPSTSPAVATAPEMSPYAPYPEPSEGPEIITAAAPGPPDSFSSTAETQAISEIPYPSLYPVMPNGTFGPATPNPTRTPEVFISASLQPTMSISQDAFPMTSPEASDASPAAEDFLSSSPTFDLDLTMDSFESEEPIESFDLASSIAPTAPTAPSSPTSISTRASPVPVKPGGESSKEEATLVSKLRKLAQRLNALDRVLSVCISRLGTESAFCGTVVRQIQTTSEMIVEYEEKLATLRAAQ